MLGVMLGVMLSLSLSLPCARREPRAAAPRLKEAARGLDAHACSLARSLSLSLSLSLNDRCPPRTTSRGAMLEGGCKRSRPWHPLDFPHHWPQAARLKEAARGLDPLDFPHHEPRSTALREALVHAASGLESCRLHLR